MASVCNTTVACHIQTTRPRKFARYVRIKVKYLMESGCTVCDAPYTIDDLFGAKVTSVVHPCDATVPPYFGVFL